ncbi:MAG: hypothetical protein WC998_09965 [Candidatus Paceibacterota bacterium]
MTAMRWLFTVRFVCPRCGHVQDTEKRYNLDGREVMKCDGCWHVFELPYRTRGKELMGEWR